MNIPELDLLNILNKSAEKKLEKELNSDIVGIMNAKTLEEAINYARRYDYTKGIVGKLKGKLKSEISHEVEPLDISDDGIINQLLPTISLIDVDEVLKRLNDTSQRALR